MPSKATLGVAVAARPHRAAGATEAGGVARLAAAASAAADTGAGEAIANALADRVLVAEAEATVGGGTRLPGLGARLGGAADWGSALEEAAEQPAGHQTERGAAGWPPGKGGGPAIERASMHRDLRIARERTGAAGCLTALWTLGAARGIRRFTYFGVASRKSVGFRMYARDNEG
jgi:hypothetical protein